MPFSPFMPRVLLIGDRPTENDAIVQLLLRSFPTAKVHVAADRPACLAAIETDPHLVILDSRITFSRCEELSALIKSQLENCAVVLIEPLPQAAIGEVPGIDGRVLFSTTQIQKLPLTLGAILRELELRHSVRLLEQQLLQAQKMEPLGHLLSGVVHEFNNVLAVIIGNSELLGRQTKENKAAQTSAQAIRDAGIRAKEIAEQLLQFSRQDAGHVIAVNLGDEVEKFVAAFRRLLDERVKLEVVSERVSKLIKADPTQIQQVLLNLLLNAQDAMPDGGQISIGVSEEAMPVSLPGQSMPKAGSYCVLSIADTGAGMSEATLGKIFEPFFTTKEAGKGTGLGLVAVRNIVARHDGHVTVESQIGKGTTFKIWFPATEEAVLPAPAFAENAVLGNGEQILVVEDDPAVRLMVTEILTAHGYQATAFDSNEITQAEELVSRGVRLLLTDAMMPNISGLELERTLRKIAPDLRVVFMSGYPEDLLIQEGNLVSGSRFIQKPFSIAALLRSIRSGLESSPAGPITP